MSVFQNVAFPLRMRGFSRPEIENHVMEALKRVGLVDFAKRKPADLSGGSNNVLP